MDSYSEQTQILALLTECLTASEAEPLWDFLEGDDQGTRASAYFSHYLFDSCLRAGKVELFLKRLQPWFDCLEEGFKTTPETFGSTRSECHAWSAHPLYHYFTGILGIRPMGFEFSEVEISPRFPSRMDYEGKMAHPQGLIELTARCVEGGWEVEIVLPGTLSGRLFHDEISCELRPGVQRVWLKS